MKSCIFFRFLSVWLSAIYFATNCAFAHKPETNIWDERRQVQLAQAPIGSLKNSPHVFNQLPPIGTSLSKKITALVPQKMNQSLHPIFQSLSSTYGSVRKISVPHNAKPGKILIHIQDVHMNKEAQVNIAQGIQELINKGQVDLIALEGAFNNIDLSAFRSFPDKEIVRNVADYLLRSNQISGPIYMVLTSDKNIPSIIGIDDENHYNANVAAYVASKPMLTSVKERLSNSRNKLTEEKYKNFNADLSQFDNEVDAYRQGTISMGGYLGILKNQMTPLSVELTQFLDAFTLESSLDLKRVERERASLLNILLVRLKKNETADLVNASLAFRTGHLSQGNFYSYLQELCANKGVSLASFPALRAYLRYVLLSENIDVEHLFSKVNKAEVAAYARLTKTQEEKALVLESQKLYLTEKLVDFSLTKDEWNDYKKKCAGTLDLTSFEKFYIEAEARDQAMAQNLIREMGRLKAQVSILVTGGFHSTGITHLTEQAGITTIEFVPKITKVDTAKGSSYLSVFMQEKTPLEKLFEGKKLFLSQKVWTGPTRYLAGVLVMLRTFWLRLGDLKGQSEMKEQLAVLTGQPVDNCSFSIQDGDAKMDNQTVQITVRQNKNEIISVSQKPSFFWVPFREFQDTFAIALKKIDPLKFVMNHPQSQDINVTLKRLLGLKVMGTLTWMGLAISPIIVGMAVLLGAGSWAMIFFILFRIKNIDMRIAHVISHWIQMALFPEARLSEGNNKEIKAVVRVQKTKELIWDPELIKKSFEKQWEHFPPEDMRVSKMEPGYAAVARDLITQLSQEEVFDLTEKKFAVIGLSLAEMIDNSFQANGNSYVGVRVIGIHEEGHFRIYVQNPQVIDLKILLNSDRLNELLAFLKIAHTAVTTKNKNFVENEKNFQFKESVLTWLDEGAIQNSIKLISEILENKQLSAEEELSLAFDFITGYMTTGHVNKLKNYYIADRPIESGTTMGIGMWYARERLGTQGLDLKMRLGNTPLEPETVFEIIVPYKNNTDPASPSEHPGAINDSFNRFVMRVANFFGVSTSGQWAVVGFFEGAFRQMGFYVLFPSIFLGVFKFLNLSGHWAMAPPLIVGLFLFLYTAFFLVFSIRYFYKQHLNKGVITLTGPVINNPKMAHLSTWTAAWGYMGLLLAIPGFLIVFFSSDLVGIIIGWLFIGMGVIIGGFMHGRKNFHLSKLSDKTEILKIPRISFYRALSHSFFGDDLNKYPLTASDHPILFYLSYFPLLFSITTIGFMLFLSAVFDAPNFLWFISILLIGPAFTFSELLAEGHVPYMDVSFLVSRTARRAIKENKTGIDPDIQTISDNFERKTGWKIIWQENDYILAELDLDQKEIKMTLGWKVPLQNKKDIDSRKRMFFAVLESAKKSIKNGTGSQVDTFNQQNPHTPGAIASPQNKILAAEKGLGAVGWREHRIGIVSYVFFVLAYMGVYALLVSLGYLPAAPPEMRGIFFLSLLQSTVIFSVISFLTLLYKHHTYGVLQKDLTITRNYFSGTWVAWSGLMISISIIFSALSLTLFNPNLINVLTTIALSVGGYLLGGWNHSTMNLRDTATVKNELLNEVDPATGAILETTYPRSHIHAHGIWHQTAHVLLRSRDGRILIHERKDNRKIEMSASGHIETNHSPIFTALKELEEELQLIRLGIKITADHLKPISSPWNEAFFRKSTQAEMETSGYGEDRIYRSKSKDKFNNEISYLFSVTIEDSQMDKLLAKFKPNEEVKTVKAVTVDTLVSDIEKNRSNYASTLPQYFEDPFVRTHVVKEIEDTSILVSLGSSLKKKVAFMAASTLISMALYVLFTVIISQINLNFKVAYPIALFWVIIILQFVGSLWATVLAFGWKWALTKESKDKLSLSEIRQEIFARSLLAPHFAVMAGFLLYGWLLPLINWGNFDMYKGLILQIAICPWLFDANAFVLIRRFAKRVMGFTQNYLDAKKELRGLVVLALYFFIPGHMIATQLDPVWAVATLRLIDFLFVIAFVIHFDKKWNERIRTGYAQFRDRLEKSSYFSLQVLGLTFLVFDLAAWLANRIADFWTWVLFKHYEKKWIRNTHFFLTIIVPIALVSYRIVDIAPASGPFIALVFILLEAFMIYRLIWGKDDDSATPVTLNDILPLPTKHGLDQVLGATLEGIHEKTTIPQAELKGVQISGSENLELLLVPVFDWLQADTSETRQAEFYITNWNEREEIARSIQTLANNKNISLAALQNKLTFQFHDPSFGATYSIPTALSLAFDTNVPITQENFGLPNKKLTALSTRVTWILTTKNGWDPLIDFFVHLGSIKIPVSEVVPYLVDLTRKEAELIDLKMKREIKTLFEAQRAA
ncbi:MAG: hypothetical protein ACKVQC_00505 [Elusimicrobiota bacterium]